MNQLRGKAAQDDIYKTLAKIEAHGYSFGDIYRDWLELMTTALCRDEESYMAVMKRYDRANQRDVGKRAADQFAEAYGKLGVAWRNDNSDHLGAMFEQYVSHGEHGQFFTPEHLCEMMAQMTCPELQPGQTVCDPACGSGRNLLKAATIEAKAKFYGTV